MQKIRLHSEKYLWNSLTRLNQSDRRIYSCVCVYHSLGLQALATLTGAVCESVNGTVFHTSPTDGSSQINPSSLFATTWKWWSLHWHTHSSPVHYIINSCVLELPSKHALQYVDAVQYPGLAGWTSLLVPIKLGLRLQGFFFWCHRTERSINKTPPPFFLMWRLLFLKAPENLISNL